jgi:hypothetical protein
MYLSGEKLFHVCLLLIQFIFMTYIISRINHSTTLNEYNIIKIIVNVIFALLQYLILITSTYFTLYGFNNIMDLLWKRFEERDERI